MILHRLWQSLQEHVFPLPSTALLFNVYRDRNPACDREDAAEVRRSNLRRYVASFSARPRVLLVGEAPGPWGARFSGIPFTSERQLCQDPDFPLDGRPSSTAEPPHVSNSSKLFWGAVARHHPHFFVWNCVPLHPHQPGNALSVRAPKRREVRAYRGQLEAVVAALEPEDIAAIGRKAEGALDDLGLACTYVRHPSQGGAREFREGVEAFFLGR
ncbi:MAG: uracil-DNA glycosylase [Planctomycetota bacterium]